MLLMLGEAWAGGLESVGVTVTIMNREYGVWTEKVIDCGDISACIDNEGINEFAICYDN